MQQALPVNNLAVAVHCRETSALVFKGTILYEGWSENEFTRRAIPQLKNLDHRAYSLDLAPSDHHLLSALKLNLSGHRFNKPVTLRRVRATIVAVENQQVEILLVCVCSLWYPACNAQVPYCHLWPLRLYNIFTHYRIKGMIFRGGRGGSY